MSAFQIGPLVLSASRLFAVIALAVLLASAELVARRRRVQGTGANDATGAPGAPELRGTSDPLVASQPPPGTPEAAPIDADWAWNVALAILVGARVGYVLENFRLFLEQPLSILQFWQGGFSPWFGVGSGVLVLAWAIRDKKVTVNAALLPAVLALGTWLLVPAILSPAQTEERQLPATALARLEGGELDLASLRGAPVVVNLWATWCPPCRRELPMLAAAARSNPDVHFVFADQAETRAAVDNYLAAREDLELTGVVLDVDGRLANEFGSVGLPTTLFFDADGEQVLTHAGEMSSVMLINYLADLRRGEH